MAENFSIFSKQRNEGLYILDWFAWHKSMNIDNFFIVSNDCKDGSDTLLNEISLEFEDFNYIDVTNQRLHDRSIGERALTNLNNQLSKNRGTFAASIDLDEFICFQDPKLSNISSISFEHKKSYLIPWLNCIPENIFIRSDAPVYAKNNCGISKRNETYPYLNGYNGKQVRFNEEGVKLANFHNFSANDKETKNDQQRTELYLKHCVTNTLDEFLLKGERGEAATYAGRGQNVSKREKNSYKYSIDLFLMYISQETTPNILPNKTIADKATEVKSALLSNPKIKEAQNKIDAFYKRKFAKIKKTYISSIFRDLNIQHIDDLKTKELEKFNKQFFSSKSKKPHDFYVLMSIANLFEKNHDKARQYATEGLMIYPSFKLLLMAQSSILQNPYYAVP